MDFSDPSHKRTLKPIVTGQSVVAIQYKDGVMMTADTLLCYGNQKKFKDIQRLFSIDQSNTLLGFSGEYSDVQHILKLLNGLEARDFVSETPTAPKSAKEITGYLSRVFYNQRNKFNPLWNQVAVAGFENDQPYLGYVDYHGTTYSDTYLATGYGAYFAVPLLREKATVDMSEADAKALLKECMTILFSRDCLGHNKIQFAYVKKTGVTIEDPIEVQPNWHFEAFTRKANVADLCGISW